MSQSRCVRMTYSCFNKRLTEVFKELGLVKLTTHSLCRGCATSLAVAGFSVPDIRNPGDWASLSVLKYISKILHERVELEKRLCDTLFS